MFIGSFPFGGMLGSCRREGMCMLTLITEKGKLIMLNNTQVNRMCRSRRVLATGGKQTEYGWTGSVFIHFYFL